jgi:uncharacterized membrane protein
LLGAACSRDLLCLGAADGEWRDLRSQWAHSCAPYAAFRIARNSDEPSEREYLIELSDAVIAVKDSKGQIKLNQLINTTAAGAVTGAFWGSLIGLIFLMPLAGAALGAASGRLSGYLTDIRIDDKWITETASAVQPGTAALFVLVRKVTADKVLDRLNGEGGTVLKTSLDHTKEATLQAALAEVKAAVPAPPPL